MYLGRISIRSRLAWVVAICAASTVVLVRAQASPTLLLTGVRLLDVRAGRYAATAGLVVRNGKLEAVLAPGAAVPASIERVDLPGTTVVPGLGDLSSRAAPGALVDADFHYLMSLAHGVTMLRVVGVPPAWGAGQRERAEKGTLVAPRLWVAGPLLEQAGSGFSTHRVADAPAARRAVSGMAPSADWVAVGSRTTAEMARAITSAAGSAKLRVSARPGEASINDLVRARVDLIDRLGIPGRRTSDLQGVLQTRPDFPASDPQTVEDLAWSLATAGEMRAAVQALRAGRVAVMPLLGSFASTLQQKELASDPALEQLPTAWRQSLMARVLPEQGAVRDRVAKANAMRAQFVASASRAGIDIATGVDPDSPGYSVPGAGVHRELSLLVAAGLSPAEAIRAATMTCARILGTRAGTGELRQGGRADFFVVDGDPLAKVEDLRRIRVVVRNGELLDPKDLLAQAKRAVR